MFDLMQKAPGPHLYLSYLAEMAVLQCGIQGLERLPHGLHCSPQKVWMAYSGTGESLFSFPTKISKIFQ